MENDQTEFGTIVFLEEGFEIVDVVRKESSRVVIYLDTTDGNHWYEWEVLNEREWKPVFRTSDLRVQDTIDLLAKAKQIAASKPLSPSVDE